MPTDQTVDAVVLILTIGLIAMGLLSALIGRLVAWRNDYVSLRHTPVPQCAPYATEQRSDAAEQPPEHPGTGDAEHVPDLTEQLAAIDDDTLLEALALVQTDDGAYRFAESRIGRFVGGRLEDRIAQVRAARGVEDVPPPGRTLRVRDTQGERVIPY